jgi:8-oxo-dGTP pyrophosphatase MutT (NUDIX family)
MEQPFDKIYIGADPANLAHKTPTRKCRVILHDENGRMLIQSIDGLLTLPGGKCEPNESDSSTAKREVKEEVGLELDETTLKPICEIHNYTAEYPRQNGQIGEHYTATKYFSALSDLSLRGTVQLTDNEKNGHLNTIEIYEDYARLIIKNHEKYTENLRWPYFEPEFLAAMAKHLSIRNKDDSKYYQADPSS